MKTSLQSSNAQQLRVATLHSAIRPSPARSTGWIVLPLAFGMAALVAVPAHAVDHTWSNPASDNFNVAANWNPATVPVAGDNTIVDNGAEISITNNQTTAELRAGTIANGNGTYTQTGAATTLTTRAFRQGSASGAIGTFNLNDGTVNTATGAVANIYLGEVAGGTGNLNINGGTFNIPATGSTVRFGLGGTANVNISGGLLSNKATVTSNMGNTLGSVGNMTISGTGTYTGTLTLNVGLAGTGNLNLQPGGTFNNATVVLGSAATGVGTMAMSGGTFKGSNLFFVGNSGTGTMNMSGGTFTNPGNVSIADTATGVGTLTMSGGTANLGNVTVARTAGASGTVQLNGGTLKATSVLGGAGGTRNFYFNGGTLQAGATSPSFLSGMTTAEIQAGGAFIDTNSFNAPIPQVLSGTGSLTKLGAGQLRITGANTYTGTNSVNAGTLSGTTDSIKTDTSISTGAVLDFFQNTNGTYVNAISGAGAVTKNGTGSVTLTGANTYAGTTTVNAGTLLVGNTTGSGTGTGAVTVNSGATLGGSGTSTGAVTVSTGGINAPGGLNNGTGIENVGAYNNAGTLAVDLGGVAAGANYDQVNVTGAVTLGGRLQVTLPAAYTPTVGNAFTIVSNDGSDAVASTFSGLPQGSLVNSADGRATFTISYTGGDGNDVTLTNSSVRGAGSSAVLVSQFRLSGPAGSTDEFIELYNNTNAPLNVSGWSVQGSLATTTANATAGPLSIALTGTLPARGHLLVTNSGAYSLGAYGTGDVAYGVGASAGADFALGSVLSVVNAQNTTVDTVNNGGALTPDAARIGEQYALVRRFETGLPAGGDSNFNLVSLGQTATNSDGTGTAPFVNTGRLGAPGPRNSQSPVQNNNQAPLTNPVGIANQTAKYISSSGNYNGAAAALSPGGQISIRRTVTNNTAATATRLRFRLAALTAGTSPTSGVADLRAISSKSALLNITGVTVNGLTLESPSDQTGTGGGLNSSWVTVDLSTTALTLTDNTTATGGLPAGKAANFEFLFGITAPGNYKAVVDVELLP